MLPSSWPQVLALVLAVIPGFVYQATRSQLSGPTPDDRDGLVRVLRALGVSAFLVLVYVGVLGSFITDAAKQPVAALMRDPRAAAWELIGLVFVVPVISAITVHVLTIFSVPERISGLLYKILRAHDVSPYDSTPTAWDYAGNHLRTGFVRVLTKDGRWLGGRLGENSYLTGYPEPHEVFLQQAWVLDTDDGSFIEPTTGITGAWIRCDDAQLVQFIQDDPGQDGSETEVEVEAEKEIFSVPLRRGARLRIVVARKT